MASASSPSISGAAAPNRDPSETLHAVITIVTGITIIITIIITVVVVTVVAS